MKKQTDLTVKNLLFPLALALFTFVVYIGNDLVLPAMLKVTAAFGVGQEWGPTSMSAYLFGGAVVATFWGPLSDQLGRRKVFLIGAVFFVVCCFGIIFTKNIEQFMLLRILQGTALTLILAVGFACVQEAYEENQAVKVMALMANLSLLAPLAGPVVGAILVEYVSWHWGFVGIGLLALVSVFGLYKYMPETVDLSEKKIVSIRQIAHDFLLVYTDKRFMLLAVAGPLIGLPVMLWIALSPNFLMSDLGLSSYQYAVSQIPVLGMLIVGNLLLARWVERYPLGKTVLMAFPFMVLGIVIMALGFVFNAYVLWLVLIGMGLIAVAEGLAYAVIYRFALMESDISKGTVAAAMATIMMVLSAGLIELTKFLYGLWGYLGLWLVCTAAISFFALFCKPVLKDVMQQRAL